MKLKTAIKTTKYSYGILSGTALLGLAASFFAFQKGFFIPCIIFSFAVLIIAYRLKIIIINFYLNSGEYPFEFLSVLGKYDLVKDVDIRWDEELISGPKESYWQTDNFLKDNNLSVTIKTSNSFRWEKENSSVITFTENGFCTKSLNCSWREIIDWKVKSATRLEQEKVKIQFQNANNNIQEIIIESDYSTTDAIDLMLLLAHFKGKFG